MADVYDVLLLIVFSIHLFVCPFTKVEESFNVQATHDILFHGTNISKYDHLEFPGVVPRTFLGPLAVSALSFSVVEVFKFAELSKIWSQIAVRFFLGVLSLLSFSKFRGSVSYRFGLSVGNLLALMTASQFHFMFYISRPLPNTFALVLVLISFSFWLEQQHGKFIWVSAFAIVIFRSELSILLGLVLILELGTRRLPLVKAISHSCMAGLCALALTVSVDSVFWRRYLWPEGEVLWYNTVLNKSSHWGTSPFLWYFYSALPRCLLFALVLVPLGLWRERRAWTLAAPSVGFVFLYSFLPHKELRFVIYVVPVFNAVAACGLSFIYKNQDKWKLPVSFVIKLAIFGGLIANCLVTGLLLFISHHNYSGGVALARIHNILQNETKPVHVHISVAAAQTGVSRFGEVSPFWRYSKTEGMKENSSDILVFSHLLTEPPCERMQPTHRILEEVKGFEKLTFNPKSFPFVFPVMASKICILERRDWKKR